MRRPARAGDALVERLGSIQPQPWMARGACRDEDPEVFFPRRGESSDAAREICRSCPVLSECRGYALGLGERYGVWGGLSERDRRRTLDLSAPVAPSSVSVGGPSGGPERQRARESAEANCDGVIEGGSL